MRDVRARWACETCHQQAKEELGLDHFEGRSWRGLTHHVVLVMLTLVFLQTLRREMVGGGMPSLPRVRRRIAARLERGRRCCPFCGKRPRQVQREAGSARPEGQRALGAEESNRSMLWEWILT